MQCNAMQYNTKDSAARDRLDYTITGKKWKCAVALYACAYKVAPRATKYINLRIDFRKQYIEINQR